MLKKLLKSMLIFLVTFTIAVPFAFAQESSLPNLEQLTQQIQLLRTEISRIKEATSEAREIAVNSRLEAEKFKEETLYRLGLWRSRLGEGMMMSISAQDAAKRAEKLAKTANEQVNLVLKRIGETEKWIDTLCAQLTEESQLRTKLQSDVESLKMDVSLAKEMAATAKAQVDEAVKKLDRRIDTLSGNVEALKTEVFLAKEMAATAKAEVDEAREEIRGLAGEVRKNRELFLSKIEKTLEEMKKREEKFKSEKMELKAPPGAFVYRVKKGDSLWRISGYPDIYNDPAQWKKIFEANKDRITDPNLIYPGQKLLIPQG